MIKVDRGNLWNLFGKVAFVFAVLWFFGLLFNFMLLMQLIGGVAILVYGLYLRFKGKLPLPKKTLKAQSWYETHGFGSAKPTAKENVGASPVKVECKKPSDSYEEYMQVLSECSTDEQA